MQNSHIQGQIQTKTSEVSFTCQPVLMGMWGLFNSLVGTSKRSTMGFLHLNKQSWSMLDGCSGIYKLISRNRRVLICNHEVRSFQNFS